MGVTLDTGALIALEAATRGKTGNATAVRLARLLSTRNDVVVRTPSVVVGEWWRGQRGPVAQLLTRFRILVDEVDVSIAQRAGVALASVDAAANHRRGMLVDAIVIVTAAQHGHVIYTGDVDDGVTLVVWRSPSMEFVDSPDAMCLRAQGGVSLLCRGLMMGQVADADPIVRLPFSSTLYGWSTSGQTFDR